MESFRSSSVSSISGISVSRDRLSTGIIIRKQAEKVYIRVPVIITGSTALRHTGETVHAALITPRVLAGELSSW